MSLCLAGTLLCQKCEPAQNFFSGYPETSDSEGGSSHIAAGASGQGKVGCARDGDLETCRGEGKTNPRIAAGSVSECHQKNYFYYMLYETYIMFYETLHLTGDATTNIRRPRTSPSGSF